jgi:hypothetical protein
MDEFVATLKEYLGWCKRHALSMNYKDDRIDAHQRMVDEYFDQE